MLGYDVCNTSGSTGIIANRMAADTDVNELLAFSLSETTARPFSLTSLSGDFVKVIDIKSGF